MRSTLADSVSTGMIGVPLAHSTPPISAATRSNDGAAFTMTSAEIHIDVIGVDEAVGLDVGTTDGVGVAVFTGGAAASACERSATAPANATTTQDAMMIPRMVTF